MQPTCLRRCFEDVTDGLSTGASKKFGVTQSVEWKSKHLVTSRAHCFGVLFSRAAHMGMRKCHRGVTKSQASPRPCRRAVLTCASDSRQASLGSYKGQEPKRHATRDHVNVSAMTGPRSHKGHFFLLKREQRFARHPWNIPEEDAWQRFARHPWINVSIHGGRLLVLLVLGLKIVHVASCLGELHRDRAFTSVPVHEDAKIGDPLVAT